MNGKIKMLNEFVELCRRGNLKEAKNYYSKNPTINILDDDNRGDFGLPVACSYGHLEVVKWLSEITPIDNSSPNNNYFNNYFGYSFEQACYKRHLNIAK